mgnify:CR=1 FL=1
MNKLKNAIRWYAAKWTHPLWIFIPLAALLGGYILSIPLDLRFGKLLNWLSDALFLLLIIHIVGTGITGIVLFFTIRANSVAVAFRAIVNGIFLRLATALATDSV